MVTFNVQHARPAVDVRPPARPPRPRRGTATLARHCADLGADVLALQEVDVHIARSGWVDQAEAVAESTGCDVAFGMARRVCLGRYGNALLARRGLDDVDVLALPRQGSSEPRVAVLATASVGAGPISVLATHLSTVRAEAIAQLEEALAALVTRPGPHLLLGDLNLTAEQVRPRVEAAGLTLADADAPSYPASAPRKRIDHLATGGLSVGAVVVLPAAPVSDHRPVRAELAVLKPA